MLVVLAARNAETLEQTRSALVAPDQHIVAPYDLLDAAGIPAWMKMLCAEHGPLNGLVHSAGIVQLNPLPTINVEQMEKLMRINVTAAMMLTKGLRQKNLSPAFGQRGFPVQRSGPRGPSGRSLLRSQQRRIDRHDTCAGSRVGAHPNPRQLRRAGPDRDRNAGHLL